MTELSTSLDTGDNLELSTQLDEGRPTEGSPSKPPSEDVKQPESRMDAIKRASADLDKAAPTEEPKVEAKPADVPAEEKAKAETVDPKPADVEKPVEAKVEEKPRRQPIDAPDKFLPRAKELWHNTPHEVRSEMQRVMTEAQAEATQARETVKEYEAIRPYAEMAKQSGTTIDQALGRYVQMEQTLRSNPAQGFRTLADNMQMTPQQMIGNICAAFNVAPERLAAHMQQAPNDYTALAPRAQAAPQQQTNPDVQRLEQQLAQMQQSMAHREVEQNVIAPFMAEHPRYHELEGTIAHFLQSAIIPQSLSPHDRLAAAYDLAVRISPSTRSPSAPDPESGLGEKPDGRAGDFGGEKSVRGAPATGVDTSSQRRGKLSRSEAIKSAMSELGLAH